MTGPGIDATQLTSFLTPLTDFLDSLGVHYTMTIRQFDTFLDQFTAMQFPVQVGVAQYGGRLIPRSVVQENAQALTAAYRNIISAGAQITGVGVNVGPSTVGNDTYNAINPPWRETLIDTVVSTPWDFTAPLAEMVARQDLMTQVLIPQLAALTPNGGCYLNEADFREPDWPSVFYGGNYARLLGIKERFDPHHVFYATTAVGSEYWVAQADGRLCRR